MKSKEKKEKGITLVALVVTVIIMLILAGVGISALTGENGLIRMSIEAGKEHVKSNYKESIEMIRGLVYMEKTAKDLSTKEVLDIFEEELRKDATFKGAQITRTTEEDSDKIIVETKEGYVYEITDEQTRYLGAKGYAGLEPPPLDTSIISFNAIPSTPTPGPVEVTITTTRSEFKIQYSYDSMKWSNYTGAIKVENNGTTIYARLVNQLGVGNGTEGVASVDILNIDRLYPEAVQFSEESSTTSSIAITATATDTQGDDVNGCSGIKELHFWYSEDDGSNWIGETTKINPEKTGAESKTYTDTAEWTGLTQKKNYKIKVKAIDYADNGTETIYEGNITTDTIPGGGTGLQGAAIEFGYSPAATEWARERTVTIKNNAGDQYTLEYSFTGADNDWDPYSGDISKTGILMTAKGELYARLKDGSGQTGASATYNETLIDRLEPSSVTFNTEVTADSIKVTASATDAAPDGTSGMSGISKYYFSSNGGSTWVPEKGQDTKDVNDYTIENLQPETTYQITVKAEDKAGNFKTATVENVTTKSVTAEVIEKNIKKYQGKYVDIGLDADDINGTTNDWEIFYARNGRIFLISADYVITSKLEAWNVIESGSTLKRLHKVSSWPYNVNWPNAPTAEFFGKLPDLSLVMHTRYDLNANKSKTNSIAVSQLLDTDAWSGIKTKASKNNCIDFVIGGPTLEMWCAAWNEAVTGDTNGFVTIEPDPQTAGTGYNVKHGTTSSWNLYVNGQTTTYTSPIPGTALETTYRTFFPHYSTLNNCYGYWLASPSADDLARLRVVTSGGELAANYFDSQYYSVRPVVCLASGVQLTETAKNSGIYNISK